MSTTKVNADVFDLTDDYTVTGTWDFSGGTITGAGGGGGWEFVSAVTASSSATVAFTGFASGYDYHITASDFIPATNDQFLYAQLGVSGPTYRTSNYLGTAAGVFNSGGSAAVAASSYFNMAVGNQGNLSNERGVFDITIYNPDAATSTYVQGISITSQSDGNYLASHFGGFNTATEAIDAIKFYYASGNIASGYFKFYKRANV